MGIFDFFKDEGKSFENKLGEFGTDAKQFIVNSSHTVEQQGSRLISTVENAIPKPIKEIASLPATIVHHGVEDVEILENSITKTVKTVGNAVPNIIHKVETTGEDILGGIGNTAKSIGNVSQYLIIGGGLLVGLIIFQKAQEL
jgi:hypothetical protein